MMGKSYQRKTRRSKRKRPPTPQGTVSVETADGQARFQMMLPMNLLLFDVATAIEETASQAGLLLMKALIDEEVEQVAGPRYTRQSDRQAMRWGHDEGHVIFAGRKMAMPKPRVRSVDGREVPLSRYQAFAHPRRMQQAVSQRMLRRVSTRDYAGVLDDLCEGYGIDKSSVSRHWKAASTRQLRQMLERSLTDHNFCVLFLDGKAFHDFTVIVALGVDYEGRKHVLGLWPGATENAEVCGALLDDLIERGLSRDHPYLFVLDGAKALRKAVVQRFGTTALIQRCRVHKKRNIQKYLPKKYHGMLSMKLQIAWEMTDYAQARQELRKVQAWLASINQAAARSLEEGFEETLIVNRLQLPSQLRRLLASTNIIESCFSLTGDLCRNVKRWRNANMAWRWAGTVLLLC
ncbi:MAG: IS256 family transposase [Planctomycetota bacterium]|jgi:transposase-like protein